MSGNIIIGAGGHGKVVADILIRQGANILGFVDDNKLLAGKKVFDLPVLGTIAQWADFNPDGLVIAVGDNNIRRKITQDLEATSRPNWINAVHPNATIADSVAIGAGTVIMAGAVVNVDSTLGEHTIINTGATIDHDCVIEDFTHIAPGANLAGNVHVGAGAFLGIGCCVIPGCKIGEDAIIGAGAVATRDVPAKVTAKGVPARWSSV